MEWGQLYSQTRKRYRALIEGVLQSLQKALGEIYGGWQHLLESKVNGKRLIWEWWGPRGVTKGKHIR